MRYGGGVGIRLAGCGALGHGSRSLARGYDGNGHWLPRRSIPLTGSFDQSCRGGFWLSSHGHAGNPGRWGGVRSPAAESNRGPPTGEPFDGAGISELKRIGDGSVPSGREVVEGGDLCFAALAGSDAGLETGAPAVARHHAGRLFAVSPAFGGRCRPEVGVPWPAVSCDWLTAPCRSYAGPERRSEIQQSLNSRRADAGAGEDGYAQAALSGRHHPGPGGRQRAGGFRQDLLAEKEVP